MLVVAAVEEELLETSSLSSAAADADAGYMRRRRGEDGVFWKAHVWQAWYEYWRHGAKAEVKEVGGAAEAARATANTADLLSEYVDLAAMVALFVLTAFDWNVMFSSDGQTIDQRNETNHTPKKPCCRLHYGEDERMKITSSVHRSRSM